MRLIFGFLIALICTIAGGATSQDRDFQTRLEAYSNPPTVGRLMSDGPGFCTATLIASDEVLTSVHCVARIFDWENVDDIAIAFRFYPLTGAAEYMAEVAGAAAHPTLGRQGVPWQDLVARNIAVFKLARPIPGHIANPARFAVTLPAGGEVAAFAPAMARGERPALRYSCTIVPDRDAPVAMQCPEEVTADTFPVFRFENGALRLVTMISAIRAIDGEQRVYGIDLGRVGFVRNEVRRYVNGRPFRDTEQRDIGARFVRP